MPRKKHLVTRWVVPTHIETQLTGRKPGDVTIEIVATSQASAEALADAQPSLFKLHALTL